MKLLKAVVLSSVLLLAGCGTTNKTSTVISQKKPAELIKLHNEKMKTIKNFSVDLTAKASSGDDKFEMKFKLDTFTDPIKGKGNLSVHSNTVKMNNIELYFSKDSVFTKINDKWNAIPSNEEQMALQDLALNKDLKRFIEENNEWFEVKESDNSYVIGLKEKGQKQYEKFLETFKALQAVGQKGEIGELLLEIDKEGNPLGVKMSISGGEPKASVNVESKFSNFDSVSDFELPKVE